MRIPQIYIIKNKISDLSDYSALMKAGGVKTLRRNANILIIDDNTFFAENYLLANGFCIQHKKDIDTIADVEPYDIILCDISGVGKILGYEQEGAFIIREIHANYPNKRVIAYTAYTFHANYNAYFSMADFVAPKDLSLDTWIDILDGEIEKAVDPVEQWKKIRVYLLEHGLATITVAKIEDRFVSSVEKKDFSILKEYVSSEDTHIQTIISDFVSSLCAKLIVGLIIGGI